MQVFFHCGQNIRRALDVAGGAQAHRDLILPLGIHGELGVEGGHAVDLRQGDVQPLGHHDLNLLRQVAEDLLGLLEHRHGSPGLPFVGCYDRLEPRFLLRRARVGNDGFAVWHSGGPPFL